MLDDDNDLASGCVVLFVEDGEEEEEEEDVMMGADAEGAVVPTPETDETFEDEDGGEEQSFQSILESQCPLSVVTRGDADDGDGRKANFLFTKEEGGLESKVTVSMLRCV